MLDLFEKEKLMKEAMYSLYKRNIQKKHIVKLKYIDKSKLPLHANKLYLDSLKKWYYIRNEFRFKRLPYLFFDVYTGNPIHVNKVYKYINYDTYIEKPPIYMLDSIKILQYFCGIPFKSIFKLKIEDYDHKKGELVVKDLRPLLYAQGTPSISNFYVGSIDIKKNISSDNYPVFVFPEYLKHKFNRWLYYRGFLKGYLFWRSSSYFRIKANNFYDFRENLYKYIKLPDGFYSVSDFSKKYKIPKSTIYKRLYNEKYSTLMYKENCYLCKNNNREIINL